MTIFAPRLGPVSYFDKLKNGFARSFVLYAHYAMASCALEHPLVCNFKKWSVKPGALLLNVGCQLPSIFFSAHSFFKGGYYYRK